MKTTKLSASRAAAGIAVAWIIIGCMVWSASNAFAADPPPPANLSPGLQEVVKLAQAKTGDDVILAYIKNSGASYTLGADDILYLKSQGVSQSVISALLQSKAPGTPGPSPVTPVPEAIAAPVTQATAPATVSEATLRAAGIDPSAVPPPDSAPVSPAAQTTALPPPPSAAPQENPGLVQEYDDYIFELKECRLEDRADKQVNDGKPHKQLICKVLVTNKTGDRTLNMHGNVDGARTRVIDDMGTEYDFSGGTLGTSPLTCMGFAWPDGANAALVLPSSVPVKVVLSFGVKDGIGYFLPEATSLGVLDIGFISDDMAGRKPFHIQFKNVPVPLAQPPPPPPPPAPVVENPPPEPAPSTPAVNFDYFHDQLAPYGSWVQVGGAWYWHPDTAYALNPNWRPYCDMGQWVYSDNGWFWQSDYAWGAIPFHYGRWMSYPGYGWLWAPDYAWGPGWVCWRHAEGYCGWAPLPPGAFFDGVGWFFNGRRIAVGVDFGFGLGEGYFTFVGYDHFREHFYGYRGRDYDRFVLSRERLHEIYRTSRIENHYRMEHGRFLNDGPRERIEHVDGRPIERVRLQGRQIVRPGEKTAKPKELVHQQEEQRKELQSKRVAEEVDARKQPSQGPKDRTPEAQPKAQQSAFHVSESSSIAKATSDRGAASRAHATGSDNPDAGKGIEKDKKPNG